MLLALSCTLWMIGQFEWNLLRGLHPPIGPVIYGGDIVFFLKASAHGRLGVATSSPARRIAASIGYLDFVLLLTWWAFLYAFVVSVDVRSSVRVSIQL